MTTEPTDDLQQRCAEIVEWRRTGVLPGDALRNYAEKHWAGHTDALQMAERDTSARAVELITKWGTSAGVGELVACTHGDNGYACCEGGPCQADVHNASITTRQPTQAQANSRPVLGACLARRGDPVTSHASGVSIADIQDHLFGRVYNWLLPRGDDGGTSFEIADGTGIERVTISPRLKPMEKLGLVRRTDERRTGPSGRQSIVWVAVKKI